MALPDGIDPVVFLELPPELQIEVLKDYGIDLQNLGRTEAACGSGARSPGARGPGPGPPLLSERIDCRSRRTVAMSRVRSQRMPISAVVERIEAGGIAFTGPGVRRIWVPWPLLGLAEQPNIRGHVVSLHWRMHCLDPESGTSTFHTGQTNSCQLIARQGQGLPPQAIHFRTGVLDVQMAVEVGAVVDLSLGAPNVPLQLHIGPSFSRCLCHRQSFDKGAKCLAGSDVFVPNSGSASSPTATYAMRWGKLVEMEAAASAVESNDSRMLFNVLVAWLSPKENEDNPKRRGQFDVPVSLARAHKIKFRSALSRGGEKGSSWLCLREAPDPRQGTRGSAAHEAWVGHARVINAGIPEEGVELGVDDDDVALEVPGRRSIRVTFEVLDESSDPNLPQVDVMFIEYVNKALSSSMQHLALAEINAAPPQDGDEERPLLARDIVLGTLSSCPDLDQADLGVWKFNSSQEEAVRKALARPFMLLHGPPGTGKTRTAAALMTIFAQRNLGTRTSILFAAPTNKACDAALQYTNELCERHFAERLRTRVEDDGEAECAICLDGEPDVVTACKHVFHRKCLESSMQVSQLCPICRQILKQPGGGLRVLRVYGADAERQDFPVPRRADHKGITSFRVQSIPTALRRFTLHWRCHAGVEEEEPSKEALETKRLYNLLRSTNMKDPAFDERRADYFNALSKARAVELRQTDIIFTTCISARRMALAEALHAEGAPVIRQVVVDEAGQAPETEALCPMTLASGADHVVLFGDHKQLRPILKSKTAEQHGLGVSLFERLVLSEENTDQVSRVSLLAIQYRMHPDISKWPREYFYAGKVVDDVSVLPCNRSPGILGHPVNRESRDIEDWKGASVLLWDEDSSMAHEDVQKVRTVDAGGVGSRANSAEALRAAALADALAEGAGEHSIAILTWYNAQVSKISELVRRAGRSGVHVGSIATAQGSEWDYVILSTVRSGEGMGSLGLLSDAHNLNVALTRARLGMVVLCSRETLRRDANWKAFIEECQVRGLVVQTQPAVRVPACSAAIRISPPVEQNVTQQVIPTSSSEDNTGFSAVQNVTQQVIPSSSSKDSTGFTAVQNMMQSQNDAVLASDFLARLQTAQPQHAAALAGDFMLRLNNQGAGGGANAVEQGLRRAQHDALISARQWPSPRRSKFMVAKASQNSRHLGQSPRRSARSCSRRGRPSATKRHTTIRRRHGSGKRREFSDSRSPRRSHSRSSRSTSSSTSSSADVHDGVVCDGCRMVPIKGPRFKCFSCEEHNLCEKCYSTRKHLPNGNHRFYFMKPFVAGPKESNENKNFEDLGKDVDVESKESKATFDLAASSSASVEASSPAMPTQGPKDASSSDGSLSDFQLLLQKAGFCDTSAVEEKGSIDSPTTRDQQDSMGELYPLLSQRVACSTASQNAASCPVEIKTPGAAAIQGKSNAAQTKNDAKVYGIQGKNDAAQTKTEAKVRGRFLNRGDKCSTCQQKTQKRLSGIFCYRLKENGNVGGCGRGHCWDCMKNMPDHEIGRVRPTREEIKKIGNAAWWMHEGCMMGGDCMEYSIMMMPVPDEWEGTDKAPEKRKRKREHDALHVELTQSYNGRLKSAKADSSLPDGWEERVSKSSGQTYYYCKRTNATRWDRPGTPIDLEHLKASLLGQGQAVDKVAQACEANGQGPPEVKVEARSHKVQRILGKASYGVVESLVDHADQAQVVETGDIVPAEPRHMAEKSPAEPVPEGKAAALQRQSLLVQDSLPFSHWPPAPEMHASSVSKVCHDPARLETLIPKMGSVYHFNCSRTSRARMLTAQGKVDDEDSLSNNLRDAGRIIWKTKPISDRVRELIVDLERLQDKPESQSMLAKSTPAAQSKSTPAVKSSPATKSTPAAKSSQNGQILINLAVEDDAVDLTAEAGGIEDLVGSEGSEEEEDVEESLEEEEEEESEEEDLDKEDIEEEEEKEESDIGDTKVSTKASSAQKSLPKPLAVAVQSTGGTLSSLPPRPTNGQRAQQSTIEAKSPTANSLATTTSIGAGANAVTSKIASAPISVDDHLSRLRAQALEKFAQFQ